MGAILLQEGLITKSQLYSALEKQQQQAETVGWQLLGEMLVKSKLISKGELKGVLERQASLHNLKLFSVLSHSSLHSRFKRTLNIVGAITGLFTLLILLPLLAPAIYLSSPRPVFVTQPRVGLRGKHFLLWRFRTASPHAERQRLKLAYQKGNKLFDQAHEPLITPIGKLLRYFYLDELPQFYNILKGDMSLVGTRPPTLGEVSFIPEEIGND
ncbi:MAG: sugar transferase [Leptodesmis sp.]